MMKVIAFLGLIAFCTAYSVPQEYHNLEDHPIRSFEEGDLIEIPDDLIAIEASNEENEAEHTGSYIRERRSFQPGAPSFPMPGANLPSSVTGNIEKQGRNTIATINAQHKTDRYDVGGTWSKVVRGPGKSKPNFSVGGTYRW